MVVFFFVVVLFCLGSAITNFYSSLFFMRMFLFYPWSSGANQDICASESLSFLACTEFSSCTICSSRRSSMCTTALYFVKTKKLLSVNTNMHKITSEMKNKGKVMLFSNTYKGSYSYPCLPSSLISLPRPKSWQCFFVCVSF